MKILLDTHIFIWYMHADKQLSPENKALIENPVHEKYLSVASIWEMAIKINLGKLRLSMSLEDFTPDNLPLLPILPKHIFAGLNLPLHHRDPFDRLLIAQARNENMKLMTDDSSFEAYEVELIRN
jgi:PIN domain nuclease of toxin-antitoxin system